MDKGSYSVRDDDVPSVPYSHPKGLGGGSDWTWNVGRVLMGAVDAKEEEGIQLRKRGLDPGYPMF